MYATRSKRQKVSLGPEESETKRTIHSAATLLHQWRNLVLEFNRSVLQQKRNEDSAHAARWSLTFREGLFASRGVGPVYEVARVRLPKFCDFIFLLWRLA